MGKINFTNSVRYSLFNSELGFSKENRPPLPRSSSVDTGGAGHWLDQLVARVKAHIQTMQEKRDELAALTRPPQAVLDVALADPEAVKLGAGLNKA